jgi:hypothetical protein
LHRLSAKQTPNALPAQTRGSPMSHKLPSTLIAGVLLLSAAARFPTFGRTLRIAMTASDIPTTTGISE